MPSANNGGKNKSNAAFAAPAAGNGVGSHPSQHSISEG
jgi:hypothetical protein